MKRRLFWSLLVFTILFPMYSAWGQVSYVVHVTKPGSLWDDIPGEIFDALIDLKVVGDINSTDIRTIRQLCGGQTNSYPAPQKMKKIDLSEARFVKGGVYYISTIEKDGVTLKEYVIEDENKIPDKMFYNCVSIETIVLPTYVTSVGKGAFFNCFDLKNITLPDQINRMETTAFGGCLSLETLKLPSKLEDMGAYMFTHCRELKEITIPEGVKMIFKRTFEETPKLAVINLPQQMQGIEDEAFFGASGVKKLIIPNGIHDTGDYTFQFCNELEEIVLPSSLRRIGRSAFQECAKVQKITFPEGLEVIDELAFSQCPALTEVVLPKTMATLRKEAFDRCKALRKLDLGNVKSIGELVFRGCDALEKVRIPAQTELINYGAFAECGSLKEVALPNSAVDLVQNPFLGCDKLERFVLSGENDYFKVDQGVLYTANGKTLLSFPNMAPTSYTILEGTESLEDFSFWYCTRLKEISFPASFSAFGWRTFCGCSNLSQIKVANTTPVVSKDYDDPFEGVKVDQCILLVPKGSEDAYKATPFWNRFKISTYNANETIVPTTVNISVTPKNVVVSGIPQDESWCLLYDLLGRLIQKTGVKDGVAQVALPEDGKGMFLLEITDGTRQLFSQKLWL